jgi:zinc transport system ATP-binding protein
MHNALEVEHLSVEVGSRVILRDLSFSVPRGTSLAVIGPNGAGKTVLFKALIGFLPHRGTIRWAPETRIGYVPQRLDIERDLPVTGDDFLAARVAVARARAEAAHRALEQVGLGGEVRTKPIGTLSAGQFQRLLVAAALIGEPNVLLLDEPTAGVDEVGQEALNDRLLRLQEAQGVTVLLISHDLSVVFQHATNVLCLGGARAWFGPPQQALTPERLARLYGAEPGIHAHEHPA